MNNKNMSPGDYFGDLYHKDDYIRPDTLHLVQSIKSIKDNMEALIDQYHEINKTKNLHPRASGDLIKSRQYLQEAKDLIDKAARIAHEAGNL